MVRSIAVHVVTTVLATFAIFGPAVAAQPDSSPIGERILGGTGFDGRLWLWSAQGKLASVRPEDRQFEIRVNEGVLAVDQDGKSLYVLRSPSPNSRIVFVTFLQRGPEVDSPKLVLTKDERMVVFFASGGMPYILTSTRLHLLVDHAWRTIKLSGRIAVVGGSVGIGHATFAVRGTKVYVGYDEGEWGGGLQQVDLGTGVVGDLLGGGGPVTGLEADPLDPNCVFASVGLIHFFARGEVDRVCGSTIKTVLKRRLTDGAGEAEQGDPTEPFFGLARSNNIVWAISPLGLYRLDDSAKPAIPLPPLSPIGGVPMSFAVPGLVVVQTDLNWGMSLSGPTPLVIAAPDSNSIGSIRP